jgi:hypothetical protein
MAQGDSAGGGDTVPRAQDGIPWYSISAPLNTLIKDKNEYCINEYKGMCLFNFRLLKLHYTRY